jgi:predicted nucleotidyltransferase
MENKESILFKIKRHKQELSRFGVNHIGLFGSYARDEQTSTSDIDILVDILPEKESFENLIAVCDYLDGVFEDQHVEVVTLNGLSPYIGPYILNEVLYA